MGSEGPGRRRGGHGPSAVAAPVVPPRALRAHRAAGAHGGTARRAAVRRKLGGVRRAGRRARRRGRGGLFRGVVQTALLDRLPAWAAVAATGVLFGLAHFLSLSYALLASLVGAYLGWLHLATGNLLAPILTHALYDFVALRLLLDVKPMPSSSVL